MAGKASEVAVNDLLKTLLHKDLRIQCRARGLNPGGSREALVQRVKEHMLETGDLNLVAEFNGEVAVSVTAAAAAAAAPPSSAGTNNYTRPEGQNCGNFITDKSSSRVLAPPGGAMHFSFGDGSADVIPAKRSGGAAAAGAEGTAPVPALPQPGSPGAAAKVGIYGQATGSSANNYTRPEGQNTGNFITDRSSSRVLAPPGGKTSITFG